MSTNRFAYQQAAVRDALASETSGCRGKIPGLAHNLSRRGSHRPGRGRNLTGGSNMAQTTFVIDDEERLTRQEWGALVKARDGWTCQRCGIMPPIIGDGYKRQLHSHHINHNEKDHRLSNGECLCIRCHVEHHRQLKCSFRDSDLQRRLSLRVPTEVKQAAGRKGWEGTSPEEKARRAVRIVQIAGQLTPEQMSAKSLKGWETRWKTTNAQTYCRNGHLRTPENTGVQSGRWRLCLDCRRDVHIRRREAAR